MANPIQRLIRLVLDRRAAKQAETEAKKSLKGIEGGMDDLKKMALKLGAALVAAFGVRAMFGFLKSSIQEGSAAAAIWNRLGQAVENAGVRYAAVEQDIHRMASAMQDATRVGDEEFAAGLTEMINTSGKYEESLKNIGLAADVAAAKDIDFITAAGLVGKVMAGNTTLLSRYGIIVKEGDDALEMMRKRFAGFAANEATTFDGKMVRLNNAWGDFKEALGDAMVAGMEGETVLDRLTRSVQSLTEAVGVFGRAYAGVSETAFRNQSAITRVLSAAETPEEALRGLATYQSITAKELEDAQQKLTTMTSGWSRIKRIAKEIWKPGEGFIAQRTDIDQMEETVDGLEQTMAHLDRVMAAVRSGELGVGKKLPPAPPGPGKNRRVPIEQLTGRNVTEQGLAFQMPKMEKMEGTPELSIFTQQLEELARTQEVAHTMATLLGGDYESLDSQIQMLTGTMENLAAQGIDPMDARMQGLAARLREVQEESALVAKQQQLMADVGQTAGDILAAAMGAGIGPMAAWKAKQNAVMALEQTAMGFVASLNPFTAPLAAGHYAAAGQFAGIAAAWGALASVTGGFSGGGGGGRGGAGGYGGGRDAAGRMSQGTQPIGPELTVYFTGEGFDAVNPKVQRVVYTAMRAAESSAGANARVRTFRGSIPQKGGSGQ